MYDDPTYIRANEIKVRLNDHELALVEAMARFNHRRPASFVRELLLASAKRMESEATAQKHGS